MRFNGILCGLALLNELVSMDIILFTITLLTVETICLKQYVMDRGLESLITDGIEKTSSTRYVQLKVMQVKEIIRPPDMLLLDST